MLLDLLEVTPLGGYSGGVLAACAGAAFSLPPSVHLTYAQLEKRGLLLRFIRPYQSGQSGRVLPAGFGGAAG